MAPQDEVSVQGISMKLDISAEVCYWTRRDRYLWTACLFAGSAAIYCCRTAMPLCAVTIEKEFGWSKTDAGTILSSFFWGYSMTQVAGGYLSDRVGGDKVILAAALVWSLITFWTPLLVAMPSSNSVVFVVLVISRVLLGAAQGMHYPSASSLTASKVSEQERTWVFTCLLSGSHLGTIIAGSVGSFALYQWGWRAVFYMMGACGLSWALVVRALVHKEREKARILSLEASVLSEKQIKKQESSVPWLVMFRSAAFWSIVIGHFCQAYCFFIMYSWIPTYFHEQYPEGKGWVFNVLPWLLKLICTNFAGWVGDNMLKAGYPPGLTRKLLETIAIIGSVAFLICLSHVTSYSAALFCVTGSMMSLGFHNSGIMCNPHDIAPKYAGSVFGFMNMGAAIPGFVGVYVTGYILDTTGSWAAIFNSTSVVMLFGWIIFIVFGSGKKIID